MARPSAEQRKEMIIQAVLEVFRHKGIAASSTRDVAERTGLARSHIYHYFKDWQELCLIAVEQFSHREINELRECLLPLPAREALTFFIRDYLPGRQDDSWCIYLDAWKESLRNPVFAQSYQKVFNEWRDILVEILLQGMQSGDFNADQNAQQSARQITALLNGYADELILDPNPAAVERAFDDVMDLVNRLVYRSSVP